jgi:CheY-like chemotaxis protein
MSTDRKPEQSEIPSQSSPSTPLVSEIRGLSNDRGPTNEIITIDPPTNSDIRELTPSSISTTHAKLLQDAISTFSAAEAAPQTAEQWLKKAQLWIIDDQPLILLATERIMARHVQSVHTFTNPTDALGEIENGTRKIPDAIICDLNLANGLSGLDIYISMAELFHKNNLNFPIFILMSGETNPETDDIAFLQKPFKPQDIVDLLKKEFNKSQK